MKNLKEPDWKKSNWEKKGKSILTFILPLIYIIFCTIFFILVYTKAGSAQGLGGYGGLTIHQKRKLITEKTQVDAIRAEYKRMAEESRIRANTLRRSDAAKNMQHNKKVLKMQRKEYNAKR